MNPDHALLPSEFPESWADSFGQDGYGVWQGIYLHDIEVRFRWIPPGDFLMGSPEDEEDHYDDEDPQHRVRFAQGFWLAEAACTQELWQAVMERNPSRFEERGPEHPVERVSWNDVQTFIAKVNSSHPALDLRLPSEAEWEYACRADTITHYWFGDRISPEGANYAENNNGTVPVRWYPRNPWGLYQMHGNVWEWCQDRWPDNDEGTPEADQAGMDGDSESRVLRGGSWLIIGRPLRSASRHRAPVTLSLDDFGFRLARGLERQSGQPAREQP